MLTCMAIFSMLERALDADFLMLGSNLMDREKDVYIL